MRLLKLCGLVLLWVCLAIAAAVLTARGQPHHHPTETITGAAARFYETWMRPDQPSVSCCNQMDCATVSAVRFVGGQIEAQRKSDGAWLRIPPEKIEHDRDSPDGQSHMCSMGAAVFCFKLGAGG